MRVLLLLRCWEPVVGGWVMRNEDPPNKEVHASDLAHALSMLKTDQMQESHILNHNSREIRTTTMVLRIVDEGAAPATLLGAGTRTRPTRKSTRRIWHMHCPC
jgi:hypothetical protein